MSTRIISYSYNITLAISCMHSQSRNQTIAPVSALLLPRPQEPGELEDFQEKSEKGRSTQLLMPSSSSFSFPRLVTFPQQEQRIRATWKFMAPDRLLRFQRCACLRIHWCPDCFRRLHDSREKPNIRSEKPPALWQSLWQTCTLLR